MLKKGGRRSSEYYVIYIKKKVSSVSIRFENKERGVRPGRQKTDGVHKSCKALEPSTRSLL